MAEQPKVCNRCAAELKYDFCTDLTCPFTGHYQDCPAGWTGHPSHKFHDCICICTGKVKSYLNRLAGGQTLQLGENGIARVWKSGSQIHVQVFEDVEPDAYPLSLAGVERVMQAVGEQT